MGIPGSTLANLIEKVRSWISWGYSDSNSMARGFQTTQTNCNGFCHCGASTLNSCIKYRCLSCGRWWCGKCVQDLASLDVATPSHVNETTGAIFDIKTCKLCFELGLVDKSAQRCSGKVYPCESPRQGPETLSPSFSGEKFDGHFPHGVTRIADDSYQSSPLSFHHSSSRYELDFFLQSVRSSNLDRCLLQ